jgi:hypothetical protein
MLILWQSYSTLFSISTAIIFTVWLVTVGQYLVALLSLNGLIFFNILWSMLSFIELAVLWRNRDSFKTTSLSSAAVWLFPGLIGVFWILLFFANLSGFTDVGLTWAMSGDSATFVTQARDIANLGGNEIWNNAVPIPPALVALALISGRDMTLLAPTLAHDVQAYGMVWALGIALTSWACGALVVAILKTRTLPKWILYTAGIGASFIPMTWVYSGYATWYGFFNSTIVLCALFLSVLAFFGGRKRPLALLGFYFFAASVVFLVWSPFIVVPIALGAFVFFRHVKKFRRAPNIDWIVSSVGLFQLLLLAAFQVVPLIIATQSASVPGATLLSLSGAAVYFRPIFIALIFSGSLVALFFGFWKKDREVFWGLTTMLLAILAGFVYMIYGSGKFDFPWLYYPSKFIWVGMLLLIPIALGSILAWILSKNQKSLFLVMVLVFSAVFSFLFFRATAAWGHINAGIETPTVLHQLLIEREVTGIDQTANRSVSEEIFALEKQDHLRMLWQSENPWEDQINFWMLKMWSISDHGALMLGDFTYGLKERTLENLCDLLIEVRTPVELVTANPDLAGDVSRTCPEVKPIITQVESYQP